MAVEAQEQSVVEETTTPITEQTPAVESVPADAVADVQSGDEGGADAQPGIDDELASLARHYNIDPADFGNDPGRVQAVVGKYDRQLAEYGRRLMEQGQPQDKPATAPAPKQAATEQFDLDKVLPGEISGDFDPALIGWTKSARDGIKTVHSQLQQQMAAELEAIRQEYRQELEPVKQRIQQRENEILVQQVDGFFGGLGKEWEGEFGKGSVRDVAARNPMLAQQRNEVYVLAEQLGLAQQNMGQQVSPLNERLKRALHARYADKQTTFTRQQLIQEAAKQKSVAAGNGRKRTSPPTGRELATQAFREGLKQLQTQGLMPSE